MAQETNFGAEKLTSRIVEEAEAEAGRIIVEAEAKAGGISSQAEAEAERLNIEYAKKAEKAAADIIERSRTNGALDSRKTALREKRRVLDEAFELAEKELCALEGEKREALLSLMIRENVKGGETLRPAKPDRARLASLIEKQNSSLPCPVELGEDIEAGSGCWAADTRRTAPLRPCSVTSVKGAKAKRPACCSSKGGPVCHRKALFTQLPA